MKNVSVLVAIVVMIVFVGCSSKGVELEKSPCAFNEIVYSIKV